MVTARRVLVTGDLGFLGRHFADELDRRGWRVFGLDTQRSPSLDDLRWRLPPTGEYPRDRYELVVHAAAVIGGRGVIEGDPLALAENLELDAVLFRWAARARPGRLLYLSSSAVYPTHLQLPPFAEPLGSGGAFALREDMADAARGGYCGQPDRLYGWSKLVGEALAHELAGEGVPVTIVRPFSGYGSDQAADYPFGAFVDRALRRADPFEVWGDGSQVRDFVHVDDLVGCALAAVDAELAGPLNICSGTPTSFTALAELVVELAGYRPTIKPRPSAPAGVEWRVGDPTQMLKVWRPRVSLEDGVRRALSERRPAAG